MSYVYIRVLQRNSIIEKDLRNGLMRLWGLGSLKFIEQSGRLEIQVGIGIVACCQKSARAGQDMHAGFLCCSLEAELCLLQETSVFVS